MKDFKARVGLFSVISTSHPFKKFIGRSAQELAQHPNAGCVFAMRVDVAGLPVNAWAA